MKTTYFPKSFVKGEIEKIVTEMLDMGFKPAGRLDRLLGYQMKSKDAKVGVSVRTFPNIYRKKGQPLTFKGMVVKTNAKGMGTSWMSYPDRDRNKIKTYIESFLHQDAQGPPEEAHEDIAYVSDLRNRVLFSKR